MGLVVRPATASTTAAVGANAPKIPPENAMVDSAAGTSEFAKLVNSGRLQVVHDTPENMTQRENAIRVLGPLVAGQK